MVKCTKTNFRRSILFILIFFFNIATFFYNLINDMTYKLFNNNNKVG